MPPTMYVPPVGKYCDRAFVAPVDRHVVDKGLLDAATTGGFSACLQHLVSGADVNCTAQGSGES